MSAADVSGVSCLSDAYRQIRQIRQRKNRQTTHKPDSKPDRKEGGRAMEIVSLLDQAHTLEQAARRKRREAGAQLAILRDQTPVLAWHPRLGALGLDVRSAEVLIRMATGSEAP
jgi:hypothetical protein